jgi:hypothetical protein
VAIEQIRGDVPSDVIDYLREREPPATGMLAVLLRPRENRQQWRLWLVRRDGGDIGGVLLSSRYCFDRWTGFMLLEDLDCAQEMAQALDRSNIWQVTGPAEAIEAVVPFAKRGRRSGGTWFHYIPCTPRTHPHNAGAGADRSPAAGDTETVGGSEIRVRPASPSDLMKLVSLYAEGDRLVRPPWRRVRAAVRKAIPYTVVAESSDGVVGAIKVTPGAGYAIINRTVVEPSLRGGRVAFSLLTYAALAAMAEGRGICGFRAEPRMAAVQRALRSAYSEAVTLGEPAAWRSVYLWPPKRFRGQTKLRWFIERTEDRIGRPAEIRPKP